MNITDIPDATETVDQDIASPSTSTTTIADLSSGDYTSFQGINAKMQVPLSIIISAHLTRFIRAHYSQS